MVELNLTEPDFQRFNPLDSRGFIAVLLLFIAFLVIYFGR